MFAMVSQSVSSAIEMPCTRLQVAFGNCHKLLKCMQRLVSAAVMSDDRLG